MDFVVRNNTGATGLDGAFRVQLAPDAIPQAGLVFNELCEITAEDGRLVGCGIVWRATEKLGSAPKTKPVRLSETMRDAFGIKEGSVVSLAPHKSGILHADRIVLTDVTSDSQLPDQDKESMRWRGRCTTALYNVEAIATGTTFDVAARKGLKKRFVIESITSSQSQPGVPHLCYVTDDTQLDFGHGTDSAPQSPGIAQNGDHLTPLSTDGIGGLVEQIEALNTSMRLVLQQTRNVAKSPCTTRRNWPVILHGYEGTGKSLLLKRVAETGAFRKTIRLNTNTLDGSTTTKKKTITDTFTEARAHQPSLILMDDLQKLTPSTDDGGPLVATLCSELDSISGTGILVLAATRSLHDVHPALLGPERFVKEIELPIPDLQARERILNALLSDPADADEPSIANLSSRTHGFTCRDLAKSVAIARMHALERNVDGAPSVRLANDGSISDHLADHERSDADARNGEAFDDAINHGDHADDSQLTPSDHHPCSEADWTFALSRVRPAALREILFTTPQVFWQDIGGSQRIQKHLDRIIGWPLKHADLMKQHKLSAKKGMLLYGPPGCSKTLTAQAVAATYAMNFIAIKGAELISMYVGESERAVREIFRKARAARPCIIFFDEIDSIASERESGGSKGLNVLTTLLNEMDGFDSLAGVFVLAATNKPEALDPAIMRPGRFDRHLYLPPPDEGARREIFEMQLTTSPYDVDIDDIVRRTAGYTGAEVVAVCNLVKEGAFERLLALDHGGTTPVSGFEIRADDFEKALGEVLPRVTGEMLASYEAFGKR